MGRGRAAAAAAAAFMFVAASPMPTAAASVGLAPGTKLFFRGGGECSLGFLATNAAGDRLAVTAGHCANDVDQEVLSEHGNRIGWVAHHTPDKIAAGVYGVTLINLSGNTYTADAYFTQFGNPSVGDHVAKFGARTDKTEGTVVDISVDPDHPWRSQMESTLVGLPGDSGSAWVGDGAKGPVLVGLNIGHTIRKDGGYGFAIGFPIRSLIAVVKANSPHWGPGFTPVGPET